MKPATKMMPVAAAVAALSTLMCCLPISLSAAIGVAGLAVAIERYRNLFCDSVRYLPCCPCVTALSLQASMSNKQPKRDCRVFDRGDDRFGSVIVPAGHRGCSCGSIPI